MTTDDSLPYKAAIDIGTNSMHLVVARIGEHGGFEFLTREKETVRVGQGGGEMKRLAPDAIERGIATLGRMVQVASSFGPVELVAVATSAVREASNRDEFLHRARTGAHERELLDPTATYAAAGASRGASAVFRAAASPAGGRPATPTVAVRCRRSRIPS